MNTVRGNAAYVSVTELGDVDIFIETGKVSKAIGGHSVTITTSKAVFKNVNVHELTPTSPETAEHQLVQ